MLGDLGSGELLVILLVALLVFGAKRMPEIGRSLGKGIREFNRTRQRVTEQITNLTNEVTEPMNDVEKELQSVGQVTVGASFIPDLIPDKPVTDNSMISDPVPNPDPVTSTSEPTHPVNPYAAYLAAARKPHPEA